VISLAGVVVNNAIVLLDYIGKLRARGLAKLDAIIQGGVTRLRPVLLTAGTTILGLVPMAVGISFDFKKFHWVTDSDSVQWWQGMAVAVIFGLLFATALTLVIVPVMYSTVDSLNMWLRKRFGRLVNQD
jgi:multidrug efflux pump subunit AcrB